MASCPGDICGHCGARSVRPSAAMGQTVPYRMFAALAIPADFSIRTCGSCGTASVDPKTAEQLAGVMAQAFAAELRRRVRAAVAKVCQFIPQRKLEKRLGLSQGYISRLLHNKTSPSAALVALLTLLAHDPRQRLGEVAQDWDEPYPSDRDEGFHFCKYCRRPMPGSGAP